MVSLESTGEWGSAILLRSHCISFHCPFSFPLLLLPLLQLLWHFLSVHTLLIQFIKLTRRYLLVFAEKFSIFLMFYLLNLLSIWSNEEVSTRWTAEVYEQEERTDLQLSATANYESSQQLIQPNSSFLSKGGGSIPFLLVLTSSSFFLPCFSAVSAGELCLGSVALMSARLNYNSAEKCLISFPFPFLFFFPGLVPVDKWVELTNQSTQQEPDLFNDRYMELGPAKS